MELCRSCSEIATRQSAEHLSASARVADLEQELQAAEATSAKACWRRIFLTLLASNFGIALRFNFLFCHLACVASLPKCILNSIVLGFVAYVSMYFSWVLENMCCEQPLGQVNGIIWLSRCLEISAVTLGAQYLGSPDSQYTASFFFMITGDSSRRSRSTKSWRWKWTLGLIPMQMLADGVSLGQRGAGEPWNIMKFTVHLNKLNLEPENWTVWKKCKRWLPMFRVSVHGCRWKAIIYPGRVFRFHAVWASSGHARNNAC